jgi:DNA-directed RNA polymerase specialized sigma24 family protein
MEIMGNGSKSPIFTTTEWSVVLSAGDDRSPGAAAALGRLCEVYRYPIYAFACRSGYSHENAEDLTQGFFAQMIEKRGFRGLDAKKGKFRSFLLKTFKNFSANERRYARAQKRGGGQTPVSLDDESSKAEYQNCCSKEISAEKLYEREWANILLTRSLERLRIEYSRKGPVKRSRQKFYNACKGLLTGEKPAKRYAALAKRLRTTAPALKMKVKRMRERFNEFLRAEIAHTVSSPEQIDSELKAFRAALSS